jgi:hypothetical protein
MLVKVLNDSMTHFNYKYTFGLNILQDKLNIDQTIPVGEGGFYYCDINYLDSHVYRGDFVCIVEIPDDAIVIPLEMNGLKYFRTNKIILLNEIYRFDNDDDVSYLISLNNRLRDYLNDPFYLNDPLSNRTIQ